jgi:hypothetical protein
LADTGRRRRRRLVVAARALFLRAMLPPFRRGLREAVALRACRAVRLRARLLAANARCALSCAGENRRRVRRFALFARRVTPDSFRRALRRRGFSPTARRADDVNSLWARFRRFRFGGLMRKGIMVMAP